MSTTGGKTIKNTNIWRLNNVLLKKQHIREKIVKNSDIWRLNNTLLRNQHITEKIKKEIKICIEMNENENTTTQTYRTL